MTERVRLIHGRRLPHHIEPALIWAAIAIGLLACIVAGVLDARAIP